MTTAQPQDAPLTLGAEFPAATREAWLAAVDKALKGGDFEKRLVGATADGLRIDPLSTRADWPDGQDPSGFPGLPPFTRGSRPAGQANAGWDIRQRHAHPDPLQANRHILADLERGATSIQLVIDTARPPSGQGVHVPHLDALDAVLKGVFLDLAPISLDGTDDGLVRAALLTGLWKSRGHGRTDVSGALNMDPLGALSRGASLSGPLDVTLARAAAIAARAHEAWPHATSFCADGRPCHGAGASEAQELGVALATGLAYLRAMETAGLTLEAAFRQILFTLTIDSDVFLSIAKLRAARRLWARVAGACGIEGAEGAMTLQAVTADRMLSVRDPWVNILRTTIACFAGAVGGADSITVLPFTAALGQPNAAARRIARNIQIVLMEETGLARVIDPAGGSWSIERLTDSLAEEGWRQFQAIEGDGGMAASLTSGALAARIAEKRGAREQAIATRRQPLTGVSEFPNLAEADIPVDTVDFAALAQAADAAASDRRADARARSGTDGLANARGAPAGDQIALLNQGVEAGTLASDLDAALRRIAGDQDARLPDPFPVRRLAAPYEALRAASDRATAVKGARPTVLLIPLGRLADSSARTSFARNLYAAGGLDAHDPGPLETAEAVRAAYRSHPVPVVVLCSSTEVYETLGPAAVEALRAEGADQIVIAGRAGEMPDGTAVDRAIFTGCDVLETLRDAQARFGIAPAP